MKIIIIIFTIRFTYYFIMFINGYKPDYSKCKLEIVNDNFYDNCITFTKTNHSITR